jgi:hypothetical protein
MARERKITLIGEQRADVDAKAIARVLIRLARHWQAERQKATKAEPPKERP